MQATMKTLTMTMAAMGIAALTAQAQGPNKINFQGRIADGTNLLNGPVGLQLRVYTNAVGGTALYEDSNTVTAVDGVYSTFIGDNTTFGSLNAALNGPQAWVEVVANGQVFSPRYELAAVPYSLFSPSAPPVITSNFVQRTGDSMTGNLTLNLPAISSPTAAFESGAGVYVAGMPATGAQWAVAIRGRLFQTNLTGASRTVRGVGGNVLSVGGTNTTLSGGYFNAKVLSSATVGVLGATGVGADVDVESGATGFTRNMVLIGGRFGVSASNAGPARAFGVIGTAVDPRLGDNVGVLGLARNSGTNNIGVVGIVNVSDSVIGSADTIPEGAGVYAWNGAFPNGYGVYSVGSSNYFSGVVNSDAGFAVGGTPGITVNVDVLTPTGTNTLVFSQGILIDVQ